MHGQPAVLSACVVSLWLCMPQWLNFSIRQWLCLSMFWWQQCLQIPDIVCMNAMLIRLILYLVGQPQKCTQSQDGTLTTLALKIFGVKRGRLHLIHERLLKRRHYCLYDDQQKTRHHLQEDDKIVDACSWNIVTCSIDTWLGNSILSLTARPKLFSCWINFATSEYRNEAGRRWLIIQWLQRLHRWLLSHSSLKA